MNVLAQIALGYKVSKYKLEGVVEVCGRVVWTRLSPPDLQMTKLGSADPENFEVFTVENMNDVNWRKPIFEYLDNPNGTTDPKVKYRSLSYVIIGNQLFKKMPEYFLNALVKMRHTLLCRMSIVGHVVPIKWGTR